MLIRIAFLMLIAAEISAQTLNLEWAKQIPGYESVSGNFITTDNERNVYIVGSFRGVVDVDPGVDTEYLSEGQDGMNEGEEFFIAKFDPMGNLLWTRKLGVHARIDGGLAIDSTGSVYLAGWFTYTSDFDPGPGIANLTATQGHGSMDAFVLKLSSSGDFIWVRHITGQCNESNRRIITDSVGNVYISGSTCGDAILKQGSGITITNEAEAYIVKLDPAGMFLWVKTLKGDNDAPYGVGLSLDAVGNIYVAGSFIGSVDFDPGPSTHIITSTLAYYDIFILKLSPKGNFLWVKTVIGQGGDVCRGLALDTTGNIYMTGEFSYTADFDPGPDTVTMTSYVGQGTGSYREDAFVLKLSPNGAFVWAKQMGGKLKDVGQSVALDDAGNIYTMGSYTEKGDFDPGSSEFNMTTPTSGVYLSKLTPLGDFIWAKQFEGVSSWPGCLTLDRANNICVIGSFEKTVDFDPGPEKYPLTAILYNIDAFIVKMNQGGPVLSMAAPILLQLQTTQVQGAISLKWQDKAVNETGYMILKSFNRRDWLIVDSLEANTTTYTDPSLVTDEVYYKVAAFNGAGRSDYSNTVSYVLVGIKERDSNLFGSTIYPNPTNGMVFIRTKAEKIRIRDAFGAIVFDGEWSLFKYLVPIDLRMLASGMYFVELYHSNIVEVQKIILH